MKTTAAIRATMKGKGRSGRAPHQLWALAKRKDEATRAIAAGLKMFDQRVQKTYLELIASTAVASTTYQGSWTSRTSATKKAERIAPLGNCHSPRVSRRKAVSSRAAPVTAM